MYESQAHKPKRNFDSIKMDFAKMANIKKLTRNPSCTPFMRREKNVVREIMGRVHAENVGESFDGKMASKCDDTPREILSRASLGEYGEQNRKA